MESKGKRRGFMKSKLVMPFHRAAKPSSTAQYSSRVKPSHTAPITSGRDQLGTTQAKPMVHSGSTTLVDFIIKQDQRIPQPKQKVSFYISDSGRDFYSKFDDLYGVAGDDGVDLKAASYISTVQERFKLERANSEYKKLQDVQY